MQAIETIWIIDVIVHKRTKLWMHLSFIYHGFFPAPETSSHASHGAGRDPLSLTHMQSGVQRNLTIARTNGIQHETRQQQNQLVSSITMQFVSFATFDTLKSLNCLRLLVNVCEASRHPWLQGVRKRALPRPIPQEAIATRTLMGYWYIWDGNDMKMLIYHPESGGLLKGFFSWTQENKRLVASHVAIQWH